MCFSFTLDVQPQQQIAGTFEVNLDHPLGDEWSGKCLMGRVQRVRYSCPKTIDHPLTCPDTAPAERQDSTCWTRQGEGSS